MPDWIQRIDTIISSSVRALNTVELVAIAHFITTITYGAIAWWMLVIVLWRRGNKSLMQQMILAMIIGGLEIALLKHFFHRERPTAVTLYSYWMPMHSLFADRYSFPSGHSLLSFAAAGLLYEHFRDWRGWLAILFAALVGFSRIYEGAHWPTDVLAGALLGLFTCSLSIRWQKKIRLPGISH